jgi:hypothetical protein
VKISQKQILLGVAGLVALAALVVFLKKKAPLTGPQAAVETVSSRVYGVDEWLDSCLKGCRRTATRRLANMPPEKRERYCTVNCECGMEKMTEPGPTPRTVRAPSRSWLSLGEDDQLRAANDCQKRTTAQIGQ